MTIAETMNHGDLKLHAPGNLTPEQRKLWDAAYDPKNKARRGQADGQRLGSLEIPTPREGLSACIASVDDGVGRMLGYLKEAGLDKNTIVIYCSDQGFTSASTVVRQAMDVRGILAYAHARSLAGGRQTGSRMGHRIPDRLCRNFLRSRRD